MDIVNKISEGVHLDNNEYDQPENTMRDSRNGVFFDSVTGNYVWKNLKGTLEILSLAANDVIMKSCRIRDRCFIFILNTNSNYVQLRELLFAINGSISSTVVRWQTTNTLMTMNVDYPIRAMFGIYENEEIQRIYWSDYHNHLRCINIGNEDLVTPDTKFIDLTPIIDGVYGIMKFTAEISGGNLPAGTYFFSWRLFKEGYYTDWSYLSSPIPVSNGLIGSTYEGYHKIEGGAPNEVTLKGLQLTITGIDSDYESIQVASFYCNDYNSVAEGKIIYETTIDSTTVIINYLGNENSGTVTISELINASIFIERCKDMISVKKRNVIANIEERTELDVSLLIGEKNNQIQVSIIPDQYAILLDTKAFGENYDSRTLPLYGILTAALEIEVYKLFSGMYHYAVTEVHYHEVISNDPYTIPAGKYFKTPQLAVTVPTGIAKLAIVIKKYRKASAGSPPYDLNDDYVLDASTVVNEYYNYKNPRFTEKLKGYPSGEKIRLGVLFLDKTGRPFFVRHLYNTETTLNGLTIGPGDTRIPARYEEGYFPLVTLDRFDSGPPENYKNTLGMVNYLSVSGLDITPIKDQIGAFMIVRCPIVRENLAYGALGFTYTDENDIYPNRSFREHDSDSTKFAGCYTFYCPEDIIEFKDFSIQPGDKLVNRYYMNPIYPQNNPHDGFQGFGIYQTPVYGHIYDCYNIFQKFYVKDNTDVPTGNGIIGVEHEILCYTKYKQGDGDSISINPGDETKLLRYRLNVPYGDHEHYSYITNLGIAILDIDETANNVKGIFNLSDDNPTMLMCSVKRQNSDPYGGLGDSALASSVYLSTGHFQVVDNTVLADVKNNEDKYIFNEIDVFGGDTFVCIWDLLRTMINEDVDDPARRYSHTILLPIETRINLDLREGNHVGKLRTYNSATRTNGLRWKTGSNKWEEFNYNDGYSSDNINDLYLPLPNNFRLENTFDTIFRYSPEKNYGEREDSFRKFNALDKFSIETGFGSITNIKSKNNNIIYWQRNGIGYIPMGERTLTSNDFGNAVQLGVGGIFDRYDNLLEFIGNSNQFGLVESDGGFHWYDSIRKLLVTLDNSMKLTQESIVKGLDSYLINIIPNNMDSMDNPGHDYGILGGYDPREKIVYITFRSNGLDETLGINIKSNKFAGFFDFKSRLYFNYRDYLYSVGNTSGKVYQHGTGIIGSYLGETKDRYFTIIVKDNTNLAKIFDNFEIIGNDKFFTTVDFTLEDGSTVKEFYSGVNSIHLLQRIGYRNRRWFGNFPKITRERLVGGYVKVTFTDSGSDDLRFLQMKSSYREMI